MPLADLNPTQKVFVANMANMATNWHRPLVSSRGDKIGHTVVNRKRTGNGENTRVAKLTPTDAGVYTFDLYRSGNLSSNKDYISAAIPEENRIFSVNKEDDSYTATTVDLGFGDDWDSKILKAKVNSEKDGEKDAMLHAEVWTDYSGTNTNDYLVGGWWAIVPDDATDADAYSFGAFANGNISGLIYLST